MAETLRQGIRPSGMNQADLVSFLGNVRDVVNQLRRQTLYQGLGNPGFARNSNFDVANANAISYSNGGVIKTLSATTNFDTGTSKTITASLWGAGLLYVTSGGTATVGWASGSFATEALAIAALAEVSTGTTLGYFTVQAHASGFTAGTDALTGGTGGNVATATNYYNGGIPLSLVAPDLTLNAG